MMGEFHAFFKLYSFIITFRTIIIIIIIIN